MAKKQKPEKAFRLVIMHITAEDHRPPLYRPAFNRYPTRSRIFQDTLDSLLSYTNHVFKVWVEAAGGLEPDFMASLFMGQVGHGNRMRVVSIEWEDADTFYVYVLPETLIIDPDIVLS